MGRNFFDAGHFCKKVHREVLFTVLIGEPIVCPECRTVLTGEPMRLGKEKNSEESPEGKPESGGKERI